LAIAKITLELVSTKDLISNLNITSEINSHHYRLLYRLLASMARISSKTQTVSHKCSKKAPSTKVTPNVIISRKERKKSASKPIFRGLTMSSAGTFISGGKTVSHEDFSRWIVEHGGNYEREVSCDTTHLICSIEEYKKNSAQGEYICLLLSVSS
jgi:hypothetical protein